MTSEAEAGDPNLPHLTGPVIRPRVNVERRQRSFMPKR